MLQPDKLKKLNENAAKMAAAGSTEQEIIAMKDAFIKQFGNEAPVQKKKFASESSLGVGSSDSQESNKKKTEAQKPTTEEFEAQFKKAMADQKAVPKDLSGNPIIKPEIDKKLKTTFETIAKNKKEKEIEKKKYEDIFDKQLSIKPNVEESQYLKDRLDAVNANLIDKEEEYVVPEMQYQFGDLGFKFEKTGILGDYMKVIAPNGKETEISLDNLFSSKSKKQSTVLQDFIKKNTPAKGLFVLEKTMKEEDKKFNSQKQVDDSIKAISNELNNLNTKQKQFLVKKSQLEKQISTLGLTKELQNQKSILNEEMKSILQEEENIKQKGKKLDAAVGKYSIAKSKQGTWLGGIWNSINEGASGLAAGTVSTLGDIFTEIAPTGYGMLEKDLKDISVDISKKIGAKAPSKGQTIEQWKKTLTEDQLDNWEDEVDDYIKKDFKGDIIPAIRVGNREIFGDVETTKQWSNLKEQDFWGGAILGVAKSLPAIIGGTGVVGAAQRTAAMYAQVSDGLAQEMENDPSFKDISENEKLAITLPIGIVGAVLENLGLKNIKGSQGVINNIALRALGKAGRGVTAKTFRELVENEVESAVARGALTITAAGAAEFETGAAQTLTETKFKDFYNYIKGEKMFDTPDSTADLIENVVVSGAQEAIGGFVLGVPTAVSVAYSEKGFLKMDDNTFDTFANMANDENMHSAYVASLKNQVTQGIVTMSEAKNQLNDYRNAAGLYRQLPEGLNTQQKKEAMNLLKEKRDLQNYVEGKDNALVVKQKERITEIDNSLTKLSETNAVQEQSTTEVPVQSETITSETMETGVPEPGPEVVTEQVKEEEVVEEPTIKDSQIPLKRETFEVELDNGATTNVEVTTNKDGSRQIVTKADGFISEGDNIDKDNTLSTEEYIAKAYGEIKGEPTVEQGVDVMAPAMKDKLTPKQKAELGIEEEVAPTEIVTKEVETAPVVEDSQPKKEQWEIDFERIEGKLNEFNSENRPLALEKERVSLSERKNSEERIKLQDELFNAQKNISRADDADLAIEEYNKKKQELEEFDKETQNIVDYKKVNDIIRQEIEWKEQDADRYDFPEEFNKDPREAALKRIKEWVDGFNETLDENDLEQKNRYENEIKILEQDIKDNPLKENTLLREPKEEVAPAEVVTEQVETAPVVEGNNVSYIKTSEKGRNFILTEDLKINFPKLYKRLISKYSNTAWDSSDIRNAIVALTSQKPRTKAGMTDLIDSQIEAERLLIELGQKADSITKQELLDKIDAKEGYTESQKKTLKDIVEALKGDEFFDFTDNLKSQDAYSFADNLLKAKNADTFVHEVGHWGFYNLLSSEDRIAYLNYVKEKFYGTGTKMSDDIALTREVLFGDGSKMTTNSEDDFSEYFAEQFRQYVFSNKTDKQLESIFDRFKKYLLEIVEQFRKKGYNKDLQPFFDKIIKENKADATSVTEEAKDLLNVDTKDKAGLERVLDYLNKAESALDLDPNELNDVTRVMAVATAKAIVKTLKALVNAGITLQEALKNVSDIYNITSDKIIDALDIASKINENKSEGLSEIELPGFNELSKQIDTQIQDDSSIDEVLDFVEKSDVYKNATDVQRDLLVRDVRKRFGLRQKSAPSVDKLFGRIKDVKKITMREKDLLLKQIKDRAKGARESVQAWKEQSKKFAEELDELVKSGKITNKQVGIILKKFSNVNIFSEKSVNRFTDYMVKVFNDSNYKEKLTTARKTLSSLKRLSKDNTKNANLRAVASEFVKIDPSFVENIDEYNNIASKLETAVNGSKIIKADVKFVETVDTEETISYIEKTIAEQEVKLAEEKIKEIQDLFGVDASEFSAEEIDALLESDKDISKDNEKIVRATIKKAFDIYSSIIKEMLKTGIDPFTEEEVDFDDKQKDIIERFMAIDPNEIPDPKEALRTVDSLINFIQNKSTAGMLKPIADFEGIEGGKKVKKEGLKAIRLRKYWRRDLGLALGQKITTLPVLFEKMFKGVNRALKFEELTGIADLINNSSRAESESNRIVKAYVKQFYGRKANKESFNSAYNDIERGVIAHVFRNVIGTDSKIKKVFDKRKQEVLDTIKILSEDGNESENEIAVFLQKAYDKLLEGSENALDVRNKADNNNVEAVDYWIKQWSNKYDSLSDLALNFYNKVLGRDLNYTPDKIRKLQSKMKDIDLEDVQSQFFVNTDDVLYDKKSGSLIDKQENRSIPKEMYIDLSFDKKNANAMNDALTDLYTAFDIRKVGSFLKSKNFREIFPSAKDADIVDKRIKKFVRITRKKTPFSNEDISNFLRKADKLAKIGVTAALASPTQPFKQTIPVMFSTAMNAGSVGLGASFNKDFNNWLNDLGFAISNRGVESQAEIDSLNRLIEKTADMPLDKVLKFLEKTNDKALKVLLVNFDVWIARASFKAYYEQSLKKQGLQSSGIDYSKHKPNKEAANYAQRMVDRQQNISNPALAGDLFTSDSKSTKAFVKMLMPFSSFRSNQSARLGSDLTTLEYWNTSTKEDKIVALRSIMGYTLESAAYRSLQIGFSLLTYSAARAIMGADDEEEDKKTVDNLIKGASQSAFIDTFSPIPLADPFMQDAMAYTAEEVQSLMEIPEEEKIKLFGSQEQSALKSLGTYGIPLQKAKDLYELGRIAYTKKYTDKYGNKKEINQEQADKLKILIGPLFAASVLGVGSPDATAIVNKSIKMAKKGKTKVDMEELKVKDPEMYEILKKIKENKDAK